MPLIQSAIKKMRQDRRRTTRNRMQKERMHDAVLSVKKALSSGVDAKDLFVKAQKRIDKAVKKGIIAANTGSRRVKALAALIKKGPAAEKQTAKKKAPAKKVAAKKPEAAKPAAAKKVQKKAES